MTRIVSVTVLMVVLAASSVAGAQGTTLPDTSTIVFDKLFIHENGNTGLAEPKKVPDSLWNYFNLAHCQCSKADPAFVESTFEYLILQQAGAMPIAPSQQNLEFWVGSSCDGTEEVRNNACRRLDAQTIQLSQIPQPAGTNRRISVFDFMTPEPVSGMPGMPAAACTERVLTGTIWAISASQGSTKDFFAPKTIATDSQPPPLPTDFRAAGADQAIQISWTLPTNTSDTYAYQALCAHAADDSPGKTTGLPATRYMTSHNLCGAASTDPMVTPIPPASVPAEFPQPGPVGVLPDGLRTLNPMFLCGETTTPTASSLRIDGLENGVPYKVVFLAMDKFQNVRATSFDTTVVPVPAVDLWEDLHDRDSQTEGGLCLLAETYGDDSGLTSSLRAFRDDTLARSAPGRWLTDMYYATVARLGRFVHGSIALQIISAGALAPFVALALLWHWLTLPGVLGLLAVVWLWRRRPRWLASWRRWLPQTRVAQVGAGVAVIALSLGRAHAGGGYQPYWEDGDTTNEEANVPPNDPSLVKWHAGIRIGPYTPEIDKQFGMDPGPYHEMYKGIQVLPMLDVDRVLWTGFGQIAVGGSIGYTQKTARSWEIGSTPGDPNRPRSLGDRNSFRLLPLELTAAYRFTWLDDEYGIPVVPYVRAGAAYYLWWVSANGDHVCKDGTTTPGCEENKPYGASLGVTGAIGLAIRAERIDAATAISMKSSGIQHAGVYGELSLAKVDGFGSDSKLSVGDRTWFAGVDFEF